MLEQSLRSLFDAVNALDNPKSLLILNIDEDLLDSPATTLEYLERCRAWTRLRNISKSIPDLLSQSDGIALVGFLGHFSSGKSSLINALLGISAEQDPGYKREVGQHPTDTGITLISHRDHAHLIRKSAYTTIDTVDVVHGPALEFLEHVTLVDTPGLGNEAAEHETVIRFLHLCHVLVITIDGRRPFADRDKDFELLDTAFNKLSEVPKIIAITSAEEFLTSRVASFATEWQADHAEAFWDEAIERLKKDPRFQNHIDRFQTARRFFVDSKEGFRIEQVKDALLPIVTDHEHRARIRRAQGRYVLATAADALGVLLEYISARSENLNRLHAEAQRRADGTATAVGELIQSLESSFASVRQRLHDSRQAIPTVSFSIETVVTAQAIGETQGPTLGELQGDIRTALERQVSGARARTWHRVRREYMARTRSWFPTKEQVDGKALLGTQIDVGSDETGLRGAATRCARGMLRLVNQQLTAAVASSIQHLRSTTEAWEIGSSAHDIESSLEKFERIHDDSVESFYAYVSAPSSSDLLREHGFVGFDESGEQAVRAESINARNCIGFTTISQSAESCKERLRLLRREETEDVDFSLEDDEQSSGGNGAFGDGYGGLVARRVNLVCQQRVDEFLSSVSGQMGQFVEDVGAERARNANSRRRIWKARATVIGRFALVVIVLLALFVGFVEFWPSQYEMLLSMISERLFETVVGTISTLFVLALVYVVSGAKNRNVRWALRLVFLRKWASWTKRRHLATALEAYFDESYDRLLRDLHEMPLEVDHAIAEGVVEWLKDHSGSLRRAEATLTELREIIVARREAFEEFIGVVDQHLEQIPVELRETANGIKNNVIGQHMSRIRGAATSVEDVKSDVERISEITMHSP
ncbi:MAG: 50S ribosome-binding GTPase [Gammaproteobacteria bacterium]|nr:50S ribosome-binding GTPase [Gammaproteobacteria bacterium]